MRKSNFKDFDFVVGTALEQEVGRWVGRDFWHEKSTSYQLVFKNNEYPLLLVPFPDVGCPCDGIVDQIFITFAQTLSAVNVTVLQKQTPVR